MSHQYSKYDRPEKDLFLEKGGGECFTPVDTTGYQSVKKKVESMFAAGVRLRESRNYDFPEGGEVDESFEDRTRSGNYDLADLFHDQEGLKHRKKLREQQKADKQAPQGDPVNKAPATPGPAADPGAKA